MRMPGDTCYNWLTLPLRKRMRRFLIGREELEGLCALPMLQSLDRLRGRVEFILDILDRRERGEGAQA